jgi:hypothetical protein
MVRKFKDLPEDEFVVPRHKKGPSKLDKKKNQQAKEKGLEPDVLIVEPEPVFISEISKTKSEIPEPSLNAEIKTAAVKKENKYKQIDEEWWTKKESDDYNNFIKKYTIGSQYINDKNEKVEIAGYFPKEKIVSVSYFGKKGIENREFKLNDFEHIFQEDKYEEFKKEESGKTDLKIKDQEKRDPTQKDADEFERSLKSGENKRAYANGSIPEDAREKAERIKNENIIKKLEEDKMSGSERLKKERDASIEKYFGAMKNYKPEAQTVELSAEEKKKREENEKLQALEKEVEETRKEFIRKDMEAEKESSKFWKLFRIGSLGEYKKEHEEARERYYEALRTYKERYLDVHGINEKAVSELVKFFDIKEHLSLDDARRDVSNEKAGWPKKIWNGYMGMIDRYRKIGENDKSTFKKYSKKIAAVAVTIGVATGAAMAGGAAAGAIAGSAAVASGAMGGALLVRSFTIGVSSTGYKALLEGWALGSKNRKSAKEAEEIIKNAKVEGAGEMQADLINERLNKKIGSIDGVMQKQKQWKRFRTFLAIGTALTVSQAGQHFGGWIRHWFSGSGAEHISGVTHKGVLAMPGEAPQTEVSGHENASAMPEEAPERATTFQNPIEVNEWEHPATDADINSGHDVGHTGVDAGAETDGASENMTSAHETEIISEDKWTPIENGAGEPPVEASVHPADAVNPADNIEPPIETAPDNAGASNVSSEVTTFNHMHESVFGHNVDSALDGMDREIINAQRGYGGNYGSAMSPTPGPGVGSTFFENMSGNREFFSSFRDQILSGNPEKAAEVFQNKIAPDGAWDKIKDMSFSRATAEMGWDKDKKTEALFKTMKNIFGGDSINPKSGLLGETMKDWVKRVANTAAEQANKKY